MDSQNEKQRYVRRVKDHYSSLSEEPFCREKAHANITLRNTMTTMSFDVGIEKQDGFFIYKEDKNQTRKRIGEVIRWFSKEAPPEGIG